MQKRLLSILTIGGVVVLCFAPNIARAEEGTIQTDSLPHVRVITNIYDVEPAVSAPVPAVPLQSRPETTRPAENTPPEHFRALIDTISRNNKVDPDLIDAMIRTESNYNPWAISSKGARGLMQLIPETGRRFGVQDFFDPQQNIEGGVRYVRYLLDMFGGNVDLSLAAYNAGENLVARLGTIPPIPETRNYVRKIRTTYFPGTATPVATPVATAVATTVATVETPIKTATAVPVQAVAPEPVKAPPSVPISDRLDERGVHHFSNLEPVR